MDRRSWLTQMSLAGGVGLPLALSGHRLFAQEAKASESAAKGTAPLKITDIKTILTAPAGIRLVVVKVMTSEPGLYGLGCATFTQRARVVETAIDEYLRPFLIGKDPLADRRHLAVGVRSARYWRNGPVLNNAISGVDMALWDILGKRAGLPVYQLLGGKCRKAVDTYRHASGGSLEEVEETRPRLHGAGLPAHPRADRACRAIDLRRRAAAAQARARRRARQQPRRAPGSPRPYCRLLPKLFEHLRNEARRRSRAAARHPRARAADPGHAARQGPRAVSARSSSKTRSARRTSATSSTCASRRRTPIAMGELFNSPHEWLDLVTRAADRLHPRPHLADRRPDDGPQDGRHVRVLRRPHRLARPGRRLARRPRRQRPPRPRHAQLRHPGSPRVQPGRAGRLPRLPRRSRTATTGPTTSPASASTSTKSSPPGSPSTTTRPSTILGQPPPPGRHGHEAVTFHSSANVTTSRLPTASA